VPADLSRLARDFAAKIQRLLNTTICEGVRIPAVVSEDPNVVHVGYGLTKASLVTEPLPVHLRRRKPRCWLDVGYRLQLDDPGQYLTVVASFFGIYANDDDKSCLCHFDYEREKPDEYPEAHLQVFGESAALAAWGGHARTQQLDRLHFPVGGRRFRPILEDVIEFLVTEKLADERAGWKDVIDRERREWERIQLRAAIRRDPETARKAVAGLPQAGKPRSPKGSGRKS
jgi:hypothetical protein